MNQIPNDPVIDEIREVRHRISARFGHDPSRLVAYYMKLQAQYQGRLLKPIYSERRSGPEEDPRSIK